MKKILLVSMLFSYTIGYMQNLTVKDKETNLPIELVNITSESPKTYAITNANGQTNIAAFNGLNKILITCIGYSPLLTDYSHLEKMGFVILLKKSSLNLNEFVVSATRWKQNSNTIPSKITTITQQEVALQNPQTAADLLGISGKVYIQKSQQGGGSPMVRGFATNRLLYTVDGIRMNTAIFRSGNIQNVINLDPFATENTEVLFGAGSVIYGSDAIGGVMSFQTLSPQYSLSDKPLISGKVISRYSSANQEKTGHVDLKLGWKKWALVTSFSAWNFDHLKQGANGPEDYVKPYYVQRQDSIDKIITQENPLLQIPTAYSQINFMQKVRFKPSKNWDLQYGLHFSETSSYGRYDRHNRTKNGLPRYAEWNYGPQSWLMHNLSVTNSTENVLYDNLTLRLAQQKFIESRVDRSLNKDERNTQTEDVDVYSANVDLIKTIGTKHTLFYGLEYILNEVNSTGILTDISTGIHTNGAARYPLSNWQSMAAYINEEYKVSDKFTIQAGIRYNQFVMNTDFSNNLAFYPLPFIKSSLNKQAVTGSVGAVYRPTSSWVINTNLGTAFRAPNVDDIGKIFDSEPGSVVVPNPNLNAEYAYNIDIGIAKIIKDVVKIDLTGYYTWLENALVRRDFTLNGQDSIIYDGILSKVQAIQNAAKANVYGLQAGIEIKLSQGFNFSTDVNYQIGKEELENGDISASRHAAPFFGTSRLSYKANKLNMQFYTVYQAERSFTNLAKEEQAKDEIYAKDANGNNYSPAWYTLNFKINYLITENISFSGGLENMLDKRYRGYSSGVSAPGRNFILSLKASF